MPGDTLVDVWKKRIKAAKDLHERSDKENRVKECYNYWKGDQRVDVFDGETGNRKAQINKIHPEVRNNIPSLYYYRPFARLSVAPEQQDDPGTEIEKDTQLLQDTINHLIRDPETMYRETTFIALKEAHWAFGCVEVGYTAEFNDAPNVQKPPLKEKKDTKVSSMPKAGAAEANPDISMAGPAPVVPPTPGMDALGLGVDENSDVVSIEAEVERLKKNIKQEKFYVKHIPAKQVLVAISDKPILHSNDWVGYWEDVPLEDVRRAKAYENTANLKVSAGDPRDEKSEQEYNEATGGVDRVRLYKIWDLRSSERWVFAEGHEKELLREPYERCPLKFLRFDVDPYHFYPRPLILSKLGPQDEYNQSREFIRKERIARVSRYTYDEDGIEAKEIQKFESGEMGIIIPRKSGMSGDVISPVAQPAMSDGAIQSLTLSDKEFADVGGVGNDARIATTKTATQAKIAETKDQVQDSFDRLVVAEWLADIAKELLALAVENMNLDRWVAINVVPDSQFTTQLAADISQRFSRINANVLGNAAAGVSWDVIIDLESLSPVSAEEKFQKWMQGLQLFGNPPMARLFSVSPELLKHTLDLLGMKSARDQQMIIGAMQQVVQMEQMLAAQSQNASPGMSPQAGGPTPGAPKPAGGPQPGGPAGPGASVPKPPAPVGVR